MELSAETTAVSDLIGRRVRDPDGRSLGRVYELRADWRDGQLVVAELLVGRGALLRRLRGPGDSEAPAIPWSAIAAFEGGEVIVHGAPR